MFPERGPGRRHILIVSIVLVGMLTSAMAFVAVRNRGYEKLQRSFETIAEQRYETLRIEIDRDFSTLAREGAWRPRVVFFAGLLLTAFVTRLSMKLRHVKAPSIINSHLRDEAVDVKKQRRLFVSRKSATASPWRAPTTV